MSALLQRLRRMSTAELTWRLKTLTRNTLQQAAFRMRRPHWDRSDISRVLNRRVMTREIRRAVRLGDWFETNRLLLDGMRAREGRFIVDPATAPELRRAVLDRWPGALDHAAERADRLIDGSYDLLGYNDLDFRRQGHIDWHLDPVHDCRAPGGFWSEVPYLDPNCGDHKIIWELNRHQHWLAFGRALWLTDDIRYRDAIVEQLSSWLDVNPPLDGVNWASMLELSFRSLSWTTALHFMLAFEGGRYNFVSSDQPWLVDLLIGLDRQLTLVEHNLSYYFSPNTHLTGEALGLYVTGLALPELKRSSRWVETGRRVLLHEIDRQICADGGHAERSTHYHRYTLDFYLFALQMARRCGDTGAEPALAAVVDRLATFMRAAADDLGQMPAIGDDDGGMLWPMTGRSARDVRDSLALAAVALNKPSLAPWAVPEETFWLAWATHPRELQAIASEPTLRPARRPAVEAAVFGDTGYGMIRDSNGGHLLFDVGPHGYLNGGHAHADALAITLGLHGRPLLVDPGTFTYTMEPALRDRLRRSASHNTLTLNGRDSSVPAGPFHWATRTDSRLEASRLNPRFGWLEGSHGGYGAVRHRRSVLHTIEDGWLIVDEVLGRGRHEAQLHWHFDPAWTVTGGGHRALRATHDEGFEAWLLHDSGMLEVIQADEQTGLGWYSPAYGALQPASTARIGRRAPGPFTMVTWLGTGVAPTLQRLRTRNDPNGRSTAVRIADRDIATLALIRSGEPAERDTRSCELPDFQTNARMLQYTMRGAELLTMAIADATRVLALREGLVSLAADGHISDLHLRLAGDVLEVSATAAAPRLRLQGRPLDAVRTLRLNGREVARDGAGDSLVITAWSWPGRTPVRGASPTPKAENPEASMNTCAA